MKNVYALIFLLLWMVIHSNAQSFVWARSYRPVKDHFPQTVSHHNDLLIIAGSYGFQHDQAKPYGLLVQAIDTSGAERWKISLPCLANGMYMSARASAITAAGNNIYIGGLFSGTLQAGAYQITAAGKNDAFMLCLDLAGNVKWLKGYGGDGYDYITDVAIYGDDAYFIASIEDTAVVAPFIVPTPHGRNMLIVRLSDNGNAEWYKLKNIDLVSGKLRFSSQGNFIVAGDFEKQFSADGFEFYYGGDDPITFIAEMNDTGRVLWPREHSNFIDAYTSHLELGANDSIFTAVWDCYHSCTVELYRHSHNSASAGWRTSSQGHYFSSIHGLALRNGYAYIAGSIDPYDPADTLPQSLTIASYAETGELQWMNTQITNCQMTGLETGANNHLYLVGNFYNSTSLGAHHLSSPDEYSMFIAKLDERVPLSLNRIDSDGSIQIFPNPCAYSITLKGAMLNTAGCEILITNVHGQLVHYETLSDHASSLEKTIRCSHLAEGAYLVSIRTENQTFREKLIIAR